MNLRVCCQFSLLTVVLLLRKKNGKLLEWLTVRFYAILCEIMEVPAFDFQFDFLDEIPDSLLSAVPETPNAKFEHLSADDITSMRKKSRNSNTAKTTNTWYRS